MRRKPLKKYFITGFLSLLPIFFTIYVIRVLFILANKLLAWIPVSPTKLWWLDVLIKLLIVLIILMFTGFLVSNLVTRRFFRMGERMINHIPFIKQVYWSSKHFIESVLTRRKESFQRVVLVEYPRKGVFAIGLVTKNPTDHLAMLVSPRYKKKVHGLVSVFLPTTPLPTSGMLIMVPEEDLIELNITIEEGLKIIISGGVLEAEKRKNL